MPSPESPPVCSDRDVHDHRVVGCLLDPSPRIAGAWLPPSHVVRDGRLGAPSTGRSLGEHASRTRLVRAGVLRGPLPSRGQVVWHDPFPSRTVSAPIELVPPRLLAGGCRSRRSS